MANTTFNREKLVRLHAEIDGILLPACRNPLSMPSTDADQEISRPQIHGYLCANVVGGKFSQPQPRNAGRTNWSQSAGSTATEISGMH